jgi:hypothetical protein
MSTQLAGSPHGTDYWGRKVKGNMDPEAALELKKIIAHNLFVMEIIVPTHY